MGRLFRRLLILVVVTAAAIWAFNTSLFAPRSPDGPSLLAHRGVHQNFSREGLDNQTCTAARILEPTHMFLENTLASTAAAFDAGADIVEFDIHATTDGHFVVFHDWTVDCRTEGSGRTRDHSLAELRALDIGYGYTADGGETFPFRGQDVGPMPTLTEMLDAFPERRFLINIKDNDAAAADALADMLEARGDDDVARLMAYGGPRAITALQARFPDMLTTDMRRTRACLVGYATTGWFGRMPPACRNSLVIIPQNYAQWLWGWPHGFNARMERAGSEVFIRGDYDGSGIGPGGVDHVADLDAIPADFGGGIWTDRIEVIGPALAQRQSGD